MGNYSWGITAKKVGIEALIVLIAGLISVYGEQPAYLALVPVAVGVLNYLKHKN